MVELRVGGGAAPQWAELVEEARAGGFQDEAAEIRRAAELAAGLQKTTEEEGESV
jgi:hypothetical protein